MASLQSATKCPQCTIRFFDAAMASTSTKHIRRVAPIRAFSSTRNVAKGNPYRHMVPAQPKMPTMGVRVKEEMAKLQRQQLAKGVPENMGLLPETLVVPDKNTLSFKFRAHWMKVRAQEFLAVVLLWWRFRKRHKITFDMFKISHIGFKKYKEMSADLAKGNVTGLSINLMPPFLQQLQRRIESRPNGVSYEWNMVRATDDPQLKSYKASLVPDANGSITASDNAIIQAVVKVRTEQSLQRREMKFNPDEGLNQVYDIGPPRQKEVTEYVVLTKLVSNGEETPWRIWGFYTPQTTEEIMTKIEESSKRLGLMREK